MSKFTTPIGIILLIGSFIGVPIYLAIDEMKEWNDNAIASEVIRVSCGKASGFGAGTQCRVILENGTKATIYGITIKGDTVWCYNNRCRLGEYRTF